MRIGIGVPVGLLSILAMMILPLPPVMLDVLFTFNIALSLVIVMAVFQVRRPLEFAIFPTVLLLVTLLRLALNVASTRVVLMHGHEGSHAAGQRDRGVRRVRDRRQLRRRRGGVHHPHHHQLRGGHQGRGPRVGSVARASRWTPCPASRWRSTPTSTPASSRRTRRASAAPKCAPNRISTARWTAPASSCAATPSPASSSWSSTSSAAC